MALKVFDGVFGELVEVLIDRVKNGEAPDKDKWKEEVELEVTRALARAWVKTAIDKVSLPFQVPWRALSSSV